MIVALFLARSFLGLLRGFLFVTKLFLGLRIDLWFRRWWLRDLCADLVAQVVLTVVGLVADLDHILEVFEGVDGGSDGFVESGLLWFRLITDDVVREIRAGEDTTERTELRWLELFVTLRVL